MGVDVPGPHSCALVHGNTATWLPGCRFLGHAAQSWCRGLVCVHRQSAGHGKWGRCWSLCPSASTAARAGRLQAGVQCGALFWSALQHGCQCTPLPKLACTAVCCMLQLPVLGVCFWFVPWGGPLVQVAHAVAPCFVPSADLGCCPARQPSLSERCIAALSQPRLLHSGSLGQRANRGLQRCEMKMMAASIAPRGLQCSCFSSCGVRCDCCW